MNVPNVLTIKKNKFAHKTDKKPIRSNFTQLTIKGPINSQHTFNYRYFLPRNCHLAPGAPQQYTIQITPQGLSRSIIVFNYVSNTNSSHLSKHQHSSMNVRYVDDQTHAIIKNINLSGRIGQTIDVTDYDSLPKNCTKVKGQSYKYEFTKPVNQVTVKVHDQSRSIFLD